jgi:hypothetical protein
LHEQGLEAGFVNIEIAEVDIPENDFPLLGGQSSCYAEAQAASSSSDDGGLDLGGVLGKH